MNYGIYSQNTWLFPDSVAADGKKDIALTLLKGQTGAFQVVLEGITEGKAIQWIAQNLDGVKVDVYRERDVCVNRNSADEIHISLTTDQWEDIKDYRVRKAPYRTYDALVPAVNLVSKGEKEAYYVSLCPNDDAEAGVRNGEIVFTIGDDAVSVPVTLKVGKKALPPQTLKIANWCDEGNMATHHGLEIGSREHKEMIQKYYDLLKECHNNVYRVSLNHIKGEYKDNKIIYNLQPAIEEAEFALKNGAEILEWGCILIRGDWEELPMVLYDPRSKSHINCFSDWGRKCLKAYLTQLDELLTERGWKDISLMHICDEPKERCASDYRIVAGIFRKYLPGVKLMDAVEIYFLQDALDIYVPKPHYYIQHRKAFESLRDDRNELWFYTCNMPTGRWLSRFLDSPLLNTRLLHWCNYRFNMGGYLHWGFNRPVRGADPFEETSDNSWLPAGDSHIVYPGDGEPLRSARFMQMKCGVEDYEILKAVSKINKRYADELCYKVTFSFDRYITDVDEFDALHNALVEYYDSL